MVSDGVENMKKTAMRVSAGLFVLTGLTLTAPAERITFESLLEEMVDRDRVAQLPEPGYVCKEFSSYDRASKSPHDKGTWFANRDFNQFMRDEVTDGRTEQVMMDVDGPGSIVRLWCTMGKNTEGILRFYLDGSSEPMIEGDAKAIVGGGLLVGEPLSAERSMGLDLYLPIPYAKHCKVTWEEKIVNASDDQKKVKQHPFYYQINYRTYPAGVSVESFAKDAVRKAVANV